MFDFDKLVGAVEGGLFEERPVELDEFVSSPEYLNQTGVTLSEEQKKLIERASQIYRKDALIHLYGEKEGKRRYDQTVRECIAVWGKGSGKDYCSAISIAYMVHKLLCLKDPAIYFNKPPGDAIDIVNVALNAKQAQNVFFNTFARLIKNAPWFSDKVVDSKNQSINFIKNINAYSGHSQGESFEGYNTIAVVLDEIAGFSMETGSGSKAADEIYKTYSHSVTSRFGKDGKLILLSFPRYKGDFIFTRYEKVVAEKSVTKKSHTLKLNENLPDGIEENELTVEWDEDDIITYAFSGIWASRRPSWVVNPTKNPEVYRDAFFEDIADALTRYAAMPSDAIDGYFKAPEKINAAVSSTHNAIDANGNVDDNYPIGDEHKYFIHVDLAKKHDRCVVAVAHVDNWRQRDYGGGMVEVQPFVVVDAIKTWTPTTDTTVSFSEVRDFIEGLAKRFHVSKITFDRWNSITMIEYFEELGYESDTLSVAIAHYNDLKLMIVDERIRIPYNDVLIKELNELRIEKNGKIDHPRSGSKDIADAVCGAAYNASTLTPRSTGELEVVTASDMQVIEKPQPPKPFIDPPKKMPTELEEYLASWRAI